MSSVQSFAEDYARSVRDLREKAEADEERAGLQDEFQTESDRPRLTVSWDQFMAEKAPSIPSLFGSGLLVRGGGYTLIGGDTGVGKTIFVGNLVIALAAGWPEFLGFKLPGRAVSCLFLEAEGNRWLFRDRIRGMAESMGVTGPLPISFHQRQADLQISGPNLAEMIAESQAEVVFLDTIGRFWVGNENDAGEWRAGVTIPLAKLGAETDAAFIFGDHFNKSLERSGTGKIRGTPAKIQDCGAAMRLEIGKAGQGSRLLHFDRVRDGAIPEFAVLPLTVDLHHGTLVIDGSPEAREAANAPTADIRLYRVAEIAREIAGPGGEALTSEIIEKVMTTFGVKLSQAESFLKSAFEAGLLERPRKGAYRLPGGLR